MPLYSNRKLEESVCLYKVYQEQIVNSPDGTIFLNLFMHTLELHREDDRDKCGDFPSANLLCKRPQQPSLYYVEARRWELLPGIPHGHSDPSM